MSVGRNAENVSQFGTQLKHILCKNRAMALDVGHRSVTAKSRL
jgi:hypothetical protein